MRKVMQIRDERESAAARHPFFEWLKSDAVPVDQRLLFAPQMALFIMQFRDQNKWSIRFPQPRDEFEWVINAGTLEDERHSRIFLEDWHKLGLDDKLGWRAGETLWWLFLSEEQEVFRRSGVEFLSLCVDDGGDPLVRFAHSEAGEAAGHVALTATARIAREMSERSGLEYRYFGDYHLELESGHVANTEGVFESQVLEPGQRELAVSLCHRMFDIFDRIFDAFLDYGRRYVETGLVPVQDRPATTGRCAPGPQEPFAGDLPEHQALMGDARHERVGVVLRERAARLAADPCCVWLRSDDVVPPLRKLQRIAPLLVMDALGARDLYRYALCYADPGNDWELGINAWAKREAERSALFLDDWQELGLDDILDRGARRTLELVFLDPDMDLFREQWLECVKLALRHKDPAVRWWIMTALETAGQACGGPAMRQLALEAEQEHGVRLDYLAGRHNATPAGAGPDHGGVPAPPLDDTGCTFAIAAVEAIFDGMELRLRRSQAVARANKFGAPA